MYFQEIILDETPVQFTYVLNNSKILYFATFYVKEFDSFEKEQIETKSLGDILSAEKYLFFSNEKCTYNINTPMISISTLEFICQSVILRDQKQHFDNNSSNIPNSDLQTHLNELLENLTKIQNLHIPSTNNTSNNIDNEIIKQFKTICNMFNPRKQKEIINNEFNQHQSSQFNLNTLLKEWLQLLNLAEKHNVDWLKQFIYDFSNMDYNNIVNIFCDYNRHLTRLDLNPCVGQFIQLFFGKLKIDNKLFNKETNKFCSIVKFTPQESTPFYALASKHLTINTYRKKNIPKVEDISENIQNALRTTKLLNNQGYSYPSEKQIFYCDFDETMGNLNSQNYTNILNMHDKCLANGLLFLELATRDINNVSGIFCNIILDIQDD